MSLVSRETNRKIVLNHLVHFGGSGRGCQWVGRPTKNCPVRLSRHQSPPKYAAHAYGTLVTCSPCTSTQTRTHVPSFGAVSIGCQLLMPPWLIETQLAGTPSSFRNSSVIVIFSTLSLMPSPTSKAAFARWWYPAISSRTCPQFGIPNHHLLLRGVGRIDHRNLFEQARRFKVCIFLLGGEQMPAEPINAAILIP